MSDAPAQPEAAAAKPTAAKPAAKPAPVEAKPFDDFIKQDYLPALEKALLAKGATQLTLRFIKAPIELSGLPAGGLCAQVVANWSDREFRIFFPKNDINGTKGFSYTEKGAPLSTLEPFLIDERKATLDLLVTGAVLRLQAQKWIGRN